MLTFAEYFVRHTMGMIIQSKRMIPLPLRYVPWAHILQSEGVKKIAMESTATYRVPIRDILLETGFELMPVNPYLIKQMPEEKSDPKDARRIAKLLHKGMLRGSLIPGPVIQELRVYSRKYTKLQGQLTGTL
ncbi:MAG: IS110 family transposase, partial [Prevotellaceae bacterium]|nr:IS110 family transposase [Prevotellaceae bacterium]